MKKILLVGFLLLLISVHKNAYAAEIYKITDPMLLPQPSVIGVGRVIWLKIFAANHIGVPMFLSANPDGTGEMKVGDTIEISVTLQGTLNTKRFIYNSSPTCLIRKDLEPTDLSSYFPTVGRYNVQIRILDWCGHEKQISSMYFVSGEIRPSGPTPFLELPWNYAKKGLTFNQAVLSMTSYFDHSYPLLSSGIREQETTLDQVTTFEGEITTQKNYSSHDGYDYGRLAGATLGEPVLAAAGGIATYVNTCKSCGNMIVINHENGYQTRYMHLQKDGLIINQPDAEVRVNAQQVIGKVGATGHVIPRGEKGAHLHFMLIEDKNKDGNFNDNIPDGVTDPLGWISDIEDPWKEYEFYQGNNLKKGNKSFYLYKNSLAELFQELTPQGKELTIDSYTFSFPSETVTEPISLKLRSTPISSISESITAIGPGLKVDANDKLGNNIRQLNKSYKLEIDFSAFDIKQYKEDSLSIYSSQDRINWTKEQTNIDINSKKAFTEINHFTYFVLFGENKDSTVPTTIVNIQGDMGQDNWYRSDVSINLTSHDENGVGVDYTLYSINDSEWDIYRDTFNFSDPGHYKLSYYSIDNTDNVEPIKVLEFDIDKTPPEIRMQYDPHSMDILFAGIDENNVSIKQNPLMHKENEVVISDQSGNTLKIILREKISGPNSKVAIRSLQYNSNPKIVLGGNYLKIFSLLDINNLDNRRINQLFEIENYLKIGVLYKFRDDLTTVEIEESNKIQESQNYIGYKLLQISTSKGILKYTLI